MCPHLNDNICELASWIVNKSIETTPEDCRACQRCSKPMDINEVTTALAGIEQSDEGPGTTLKKLISWFVDQPANCACPSRIAVMNAWGKERCREETRTILSWLRESAYDNDLPYSEYLITTIVKLILR